MDRRPIRSSRSMGNTMNRSRFHYQQHCDHVGHKLGRHHPRCLSEKEEMQIVLISYYEHQKQQQQ